MIVLFDLNGTLTDPAGIGEPWGAPDLGLQALNGAIQTSMVDAMLGEYRPFAEHVRSGITVQVERRSLDRSRIDAAVERAAALDPFPDAGDALDLLAREGHRLAALTNSGADGGRQTLEAAGLSDRFEQVLGVDVVKTFKPHPAVYQYALRELGAAAAEVTMVAAHSWDLTGAKHAGMRTAWSARGEGVRPPAAAEPDIAAADLIGVARHIVATAPA